MQNLYNDLAKLLEKDERLFAEGKILKNKATELAIKLDGELIKLLLGNKQIKKHFFTEVEGVLIFDKDKFIRFINNKEFLPDSFTSFKNHIGLMKGDEYLKDNGEVVLAWAYKDCVLEGGQDKEDTKRSEIFYNETLAPDEIDRLFEPKVLTNFKKIDKSGEHSIEQITQQDNLLIKGNNLLTLHTLKNKYRSRIKLVYIDPPYNTETDSFKYNDSFSHSAWLSFMKNRIEVAKELLTEDGIIFVQCDDNEQAYLKVLMDEIFTREKFVGVLVWQRAKGGGQAKEIVKGHDYILVYKNFTGSLTLKRDKSIQKKIIEIDGKEYIKNDDFIRKVFGKYSEKKDDNFDRRCFYEELEALKGKEKKKEVDEKIKSGEYLLEKHASGNHIICRLEPLEESYSTFYSLIKNISEDGSPVIQGYLSEVGKNDLQKVGITGFDYPKPVGLIKTLIKSIMMFDQEGIVLDFFGGSGTTAQAVLEINKDDDKNFKFILCEQMDYVEKITKERIKKVIQANKQDAFVYMELREWNELYTREIKGAKTEKEILAIYKKMQKEAFFRYDVDLSKLEEKQFAKLSVEDQKSVLLECLDKNHLYVNYSEIDDATYKIPAEEKKINKQFYGK